MEQDKDELKKLADNTTALNRMADVMESFMEGLPGFINQLQRNEAILAANYERAETRSQIGKDIEKYERKKKEKNANKNKEKKKKKE